MSCKLNSANVTKSTLLCRFTKPFVAVFRSHRRSFLAMMDRETRQRSAQYFVFL